MDPSEVERLTKERARLEQEKLDKVKKSMEKGAGDYKKTFKPSGPQEYDNL